MQISSPRGRRRGRSTDGSGSASARGSAAATRGGGAMAIAVHALLPIALSLAFLTNVASALAATGHGGINTIRSTRMSPHRSAVSGLRLAADSKTT
eukprot:1753260-Pleurochrysis_carterae.AAC.1